jgi:hypothetical protein
LLFWREGGTLLLLPKKTAGLWSRVATAHIKKSFTHTHTHTHAHTHTHTHIYIHTYIRIRTRTQSCAQFQTTHGNSSPPPFFSSRSSLPSPHVC